MDIPTGDYAPRPSRSLVARIARLTQAEEGRLRLGTLNTLRWLALAGQLATVLFVWLSMLGSVNSTWHRFP